MQDRLLRLPRFLRGLASTSFCLTRYVREPHGLAFSDARQSLISAISVLRFHPTRLAVRPHNQPDENRTGGLRPPARQSEH